MVLNDKAEDTLMTMYCSCFLPSQLARVLLIFGMGFFACQSGSAEAEANCPQVNGFVDGVRHAPSRNIDSRDEINTEANSARAFNEDDAGSPLTACPTTGRGSYTGPGTCVLLPPSRSGACPSGENAGFPSYVITADPAVPAQGTLLLYLNGSGGHPENFPAGALNFYAAAASVGDDVIALSYVSDASIQSLCGRDDACYFPTRESVLLGVTQSGSALDITRDEGVADRLLLALETLAQLHPGYGWQSYLVASSSAAPEDHIAWNKITVSGHSQGGGHAAALGKLFLVNRVIQLSSVCDQVNGSPISWTVRTPANNATWASPRSVFFGFAAPSTFTGPWPTGGDTTCPYHVANWTNMQMPMINQHDDAAICDATGDTHGASISCVDNYPEWQTLLQ